MKMKIVGLAVVAALAVGPARAQQGHVPAYGEQEKEKTASEKASEKDAEQAYKRSLGNIPEQKSTDPWGTVRSDSAPPKAADKAADKAAQAKPKVKKEPKNAAKADTTTKQ
jgi:hypothetical protein